MNETLKRRLVGLAVILCGLLLLSLILPGPGQPTSEDGAVQRVTLDLRASAPASHAPPPAVTPIPPTIEAPASTPASAPTAEPDALKLSDTEPDLEVPAHPAPASAVVAHTPVSVEKPKTATPVVPAKPIKPAPTAPAKPTTPAAVWYVQLGAFSDIAKARQLLQTSKGKTYPGLVSPVQTAKGVLYRVWVGPYRSHDQALDAQKRLNKSGMTATKLVQG